MRGKIVLVVFLVGLVAVMVTLRWRYAAHPPSTPAATDEHASASRTPDSTSAAKPTEAAPSVVDNIKPVDPEFQHWLREEARSLDEVSVDGDKKQAEIRAVVAKITPAQANHLREIVMHPRSLPREKILSAYLLVEGGISTRQALKDSITAPLTQNGAHEAHSEDEIKGVREKSVRIMMIDGLVAQAKTDPQARATLAQTIVDSSDPYIKAYAQEKLDQLSR